MLTSVHQGTMNNLLLGAGLFLKDFDYTAAQDAADLRRMVMAAVNAPAHVLGATRDGSQFSLTPRLRPLDANGVRQPFVGGVLCDGWQVRMTGTLLEVTPENMALLLAMGSIDRSGPMTVVTARPQPEPDDYLTNLCWVGRQGRRYVLIEVLGALNMSGVTISVRDQGEGSVPFCFEGHAQSPQEQDEAPFRIIWLDGGEQA